ncbi:MAG: site-specific DNA-methyltransferase, partial [Thermacetogeniaceae bacterium]
PKKHDLLLWYTKSDKWTFNRQFRPYIQGTLERGLTAVKGDKYVLRKEGAGLDDWWVGREVQKILSPTAYENLKFNTQKPEGLLKRIIRGHSCPGDLVADFFCGTGTTGAVAEKLGRRWIMADASRLALIIAYKRLLQQGCKPFIQQSIAGKITQGENKSRDAICQLVLKQLLVQNCSAEWEEILLELGGLAYSTFDHLPLRGEIKEKIRELASCDPLALLEYWSVDPDYDGRTFCSRWQCCRARDGRVDNRARIVVPKVKGSRRICVKAVDVFGNESVVCETVNR